jgi:hypothetical protein
LTLVGADKEESDSGVRLEFECGADVDRIESLDPNTSNHLFCPVEYRITDGKPSPPLAIAPHPIANAAAGSGLRVERVR